MKTQEIADFLGCELVGDGTVEIERVASLESASVGEIAFVDKSGTPVKSCASCVIAPLDFTSESITLYIRTRNPKLAFSLVARQLQKHERRYYRGSTCVIAESADVQTDEVGAFVTVGANSTIGQNCQIGDGVRIGQNIVIGESTIIHPNCVIYDDVSIGLNCVIHAGTVIGADGFGYVRDDKGEYHQFPQIGTVVIEDNVEIGANSCIDRGALGETRIGEGSKIDNQVQIAHNVQIGKRVVIAAQTGISGSTVIEDDCVIGGQVGMGDHARVQSGAIIGSQAGILPGKIVRAGVWWGTPVQPLDEYKRQNAMVKGLSRLRDEVKELKTALSGLIEKKDPD